MGFGEGIRVALFVMALVFVLLAAHVSQIEGQKADPGNYLLMYAMGLNLAGVIGSAIAAGVLLSLLGG